MKQPPYLFMMLGSPGSGKSFVSSWIKQEMPAVHLRADDLRISMYKVDRQQLHHEQRFIRPLYGAMDYAASQSLTAGANVIYDANLNRHKTRDRLRQIALDANARAITVWVQTPIDIAERRVLDRTANGGHDIFGDIGFVRRIAAFIQEPAEGELTIIIDGLLSCEAQQAMFREQLAVIIADTTTKHAKG